MRGVTDGPHLAHAFVFVFVLHGAGFHHRRHAVGPFDLRFFEDLDHRDVDEIYTQRHAVHAALFHFLLDGFGEFVHLHGGRRSRRALDPGIGVADIFFGNPRRMLFNVHADVALFEQHRRIVATQ